MQKNILSSILINCLFMMSSTFCCDTHIIQQKDINLNDSTVWYCMDINTGTFWNIALDWHTFRLPSKYDIKPMFRKYIAITNLNSIPEKLPIWYSIAGNCRHFIIIHKNYRSLFNEVSYESLPNNCKKLLVENINELRSKCDIKSAQKLSILTAINTSWEDALSSIKEIIKKDTPISYDYKLKNIPLSHDCSLTEALFILHLKPSQPCTTNNSILKDLRELFHKSNKDNEYKDEDVLFYAECITGALACVLKHDKKIPSNFKFDLIQTSDSSWRFMKNVKKLMQAYKDNFIKEQNEMNIINNKKKVYNLLQDEETCKLKQD